MAGRVESSADSEVSGLCVLASLVLGSSSRSRSARQRLEREEAQTARGRLGALAADCVDSVDANGGGGGGNLLRRPLLPADELASGSLKAHALRHSVRARSAAMLGGGAQGH